MNIQNNHLYILVAVVVFSMSFFFLSDHFQQISFFENMTGHSMNSNQTSINSSQTLSPSVTDASTSLPKNLPPDNTLDSQAFLPNDGNSFGVPSVMMVGDQIGKSSPPKKNSILELRSGYSVEKNNVSPWGMSSIEPADVDNKIPFGFCA
jgi:hypothetical protein